MEKGFFDAHGDAGEIVERETDTLAMRFLKQMDYDKIGKTYAERYQSRFENDRTGKSLAERYQVMRYGAAADAGNDTAADDGNDTETDAGKDDKIEREDQEADVAEVKRMEPPVRVIFTNPRYDSAEYERQVKNQEKGMNEMTLDEYQQNRKRYQEEGRDEDRGNEAQKKARDEARADRIAENRNKGMSREEAEKEADEWMSSQAALHDPDQVAGGDPGKVTGVGDAGVNSSIGSQWSDKIKAVDLKNSRYSC